MKSSEKQSSYPQKSDYLQIVKKAVEYNLSICDKVIESLKANISKNILFGYSPSFYPATFAELLGFLYSNTKEEQYAVKAAEMLISYEQFKKLFPKEYYRDRIEYRAGLPPLSDFFTMYSYPKTYSYISGSRSLNASQQDIIEKGIADCADFLLNYPEWGPMNRAVLRAETFLNAAGILAGHPHAGTWRKMGDILYKDSYRQWEEEDATGYHSVWLRSLFRISEMRGDGLFRSAVPRYYLDYFSRLITPAGTVAEFGDTKWPADWSYNKGDIKNFIPEVTYNSDRMFLSVFEKGAAEYGEPVFKWAAKRIWDYIITSNLPLTDTYSGLVFADAYRWADDSITPEEPEQCSIPVMEDIIGKKIVFKEGSRPESPFLLLNYRDEGDGSFAGREFLRTSITAEEEKTHHGHSDENSVGMLFHKGSLLLHDAGYRDDLPSGPYGSFRADYFHNRLVVRNNKRWKQVREGARSQNLLEFIRNSGAYRPGRTQLINFLNFEAADYSRTRLKDEKTGYEWDRSAIFHKKDGFYIIIDSVKALRDDYFTIANLWHTQEILKKGKNWFDTTINSVGSWKNSGRHSLLIYMPPGRSERTYGTFSLQRHWQPEKTVYETLSSFYYPQNTEVFITVLYPHDAEIQPADIKKKFKVLRPDEYPDAAGMVYTNEGRQEYFCLKCDLMKGYSQQNLRPRYNYLLGKITYGPFETDAEFLHGRVENGTVRYSAANMIALKYKKKTLHKSLEYSFGMQPDGHKPEFGRAKWRCWEDAVSI